MARNKILHDTPLSPLTRWLERHLLHSGRPEMEESYNAPPSGPLRMFNDPWKEEGDAEDELLHIFSHKAQNYQNIV